MKQLHVFCESTCLIWRFIHFKFEFNSLNILHICIISDINLQRCVFDTAIEISLAAVIEPLVCLIEIKCLDIHRSFVENLPYQFSYIKKTAMATTETTIIRNY